MMSDKYSYIVGCIALFIPFHACAQGVVTRESGAVLIRSNADVVRLIVCSPEVIHVVASPTGSNLSSTQPPWIAKPCGSSEFSIKQHQNEALVETGRLVIHICTVPEMTGH
jgi:hypothetical protein